MVKTVTKKTKRVRSSVQNEGRDGNSGSTPAVEGRGKRKSGDKVNKAPAKKAKGLEEVKKDIGDEAVVSSNSQAKNGRKLSVPNLDFPPAMTVPFSLIRGGKKVSVRRVVNPVWMSGLWKRSTVDFPTSQVRNPLEDVISNTGDSDCMSTIDGEEVAASVSSISDDFSGSACGSTSGNSQVTASTEVVEDVLEPFADLDMLAFWASKMPSIQHNPEPDVSSVESSPPLESKGPRRSERLKEKRESE